MDLKQKAQEQAINMKTLPLKQASLLRKFAAGFYILIGRRSIGKLFYINKKCGSCRTCAAICPNGAIKHLSDHPVWTFKCKGCLVCMATCPTKSIEVSLLKTLLIILITIGFIFLPYDSWLQAITGFSFYKLFGAFFGFFASLAFWGIVYVIAFFIIDKTLTLLYSIGRVKKLMNLKFFRIIRDEIHPLMIFPVVLTQDGAEKLKQAEVLTPKRTEHDD